VILLGVLGALGGKRRLAVPLVTIIVIPVCAAMELSVWYCAKEPAFHQKVFAFPADIQSRPNKTFLKGDPMGSRNRNSRNNRKRQKARASAHRKAEMANWRPRCAECEILLVEDAFETDVYHCALCGRTFLKQGIDLISQHDEIFFSTDELILEAA
jgi:hypothetical protein